MKIEYDYKTFTFSGITMEEFRAIREFMKLGRLTADEGFKLEQCNTLDIGTISTGCIITRQLEDARITGF